MPGFFSRLKSKDGSATKVPKTKKGAQLPGSVEQPAKPKWDDAWARNDVEPEEIQDLIRGCTLELKSRALDVPFLLLPFRPTSDPSAARNFVRSFFDRTRYLHGEALAQELRLTEPMVLCSVLKWCWSRISGGVVGWEAYELFRSGETDSNLARDSFATFIPLSVDSDARSKIIFDFFDLLSAIAAHAKTNGLGGRKLSRLAGWWAFEHIDTGNGFDGGYRTWTLAADATSHLFFAYLRSLSPDSVKGLNGISSLPTSLQKLLQETEYPPEKPSLMQTTTRKVVMIVDSVSPTPFALLRRANHFLYRDEDRMLQEYAEYEDPVQALTDECKRVLKSISRANESQVSNTKDSTGLTDASWSRFEDIGFSSVLDQNLDHDENSSYGVRKREQPGLRTTPQVKSAVPGARPTTPSWADFLSSGFVDEGKSNTVAPLLLPPDKVLPPIDTRGRSSQSHSPRLESSPLEPGELASIIKFDLDDTFWWVWISSLAGEETSDRKAAFGRCALIETVIRGAKWLVMEEMVKGAAEPVEGAYIAEKKSFWSRSKKTKVPERRKSATGKQTADPLSRNPASYQSATSKASIGPDQQARIAAAAALLQEKQRQQESQQWKARRGRNYADLASQKTNSVFTLQPVLVNEASHAMKWANKYDKAATQEAYVANNNAGRGKDSTYADSNGYSKSQDTLLRPQQTRRYPSKERDLPAVPSEQEESSARIEPAFPPTPAAVDEREILLSEKAAEVGLPDDVHPMNRKPVGSPASPLPVIATPATDNSRPSQDLASSPEGKAAHRKLQKKEPSAGFKKLFGRNKNRASGVPMDAPEKLNGVQGSLHPPQAGGLGRRFSNMRKKSPTSSQAPAAASTTSFANSHISEDERTPMPTPKPDAHEPSYEPSLHDSLSRVDTNDAHEARQAFSSFDQGPLDVPAFVPQDSPRESIDSAAPPPISRERSSERPASLVPEVAQSVAPEYPVSPAPAQPGDRWAQIRKNAAERAALAQRQSEEQSRTTGQSQRTDDGETSGEETIESRVARIKARVAELTGNMETGAPPPPPISRR